MPKRNQKELTEIGIKRLAKPAKGKRREISDALAPGLVLRITDQGPKQASADELLDALWWSKESTRHKTVVREFPFD